MPNVEEKMENGECRFMCVFMAPVFRAPSVANCQRRRTGLDWTGDDCRLQVVASLLGLGLGGGWVILGPEYCLAKECGAGSEWDWVNLCLPSMGIRQNDYKCFFNYSYGQSDCSK